MWVEVCGLKMEVSEVSEIKIVRERLKGVSCGSGIAQREEKNEASEVRIVELRRVGGNMK